MRSRLYPQRAMRTMVLHHGFCSWLSAASSSQYTAHPPLNSAIMIFRYYNFPLVLNSMQTTDMTLQFSSMQTKKITTMWGSVRLAPIVFLVSSLVASVEYCLHHYKGWRNSLWIRLHWILMNQNGCIPMTGSSENQHTRQSCNRPVHQLKMTKCPMQCQSMCVVHVQT